MKKVVTRTKGGNKYSVHINDTLLTNASEVKYKGVKYIKGFWPIERGKEAGDFFYSRCLKTTYKRGRFMDFHDIGDIIY